MARAKTTDDWQLEDHITELKGIPGTIDCEAADPMARALIFFGRQIGDMKQELAVLVAMSRPSAPAWPSKKGLLAALAGLGLPTPVLVFAWFVGQSKGWW